MRVSVVIPCFNAAAYVANTITSVLRQTYSVDEVIVVDDGSTDGSAEVAMAFGSPVRVIRQPNRGLSDARNAGISQAVSDAVALLDADDLWEPEKLAKQVAYLMNNPTTRAVVSGHTNFESGYSVVRLSDSALRHLSPLDFVARCRFMPSSLILTTELAHSVRFPEDTLHAEDLIHAALLRLQSPIGAVEEPLLRRRIHAAQLSRTADYFRRSLSVRLVWVRENYRLVGANSAKEAEEVVLAGVCEDIMSRYWNRDIEGFRNLRHELIASWPNELPIPSTICRIVLPRPLLRIKDHLEGLLDNILKASRLSSDRTMP